MSAARPMPTSADAGGSFEDGVAADAVAADVFPLLMDIGEAMLKCGADVHTVEQLLIRLGRAYGAVRMNVLVITAAILATVTYPGNRELTFSRRVEGEGGTDFARLEALNALCHDCIAAPMTAAELSQRLDVVRAMRPSPWSFYLGGVLSSGGFAVFFGGNVLDGLVAALFALLACAAIRHLKTFTPNTIVFNFGTSLLVGIAIAAVAAVTQLVNVNMVVIGVIMLLIPGLAMTNATRDMLSGDTISGVMRFVESLLWATALALGFMAALWIADAVGFDFDARTATVDWTFWQKALACAVASLGFALFFDVRPRHVPAATLGGLLTWSVFDACAAGLGGVFVPCVLASTFAAVYSEALSRALRVPNAVFFIVSVIPLVPGRSLYYTMYNAVAGDFGACASFAVSTLLYAAGIAAGICLIAAVVQTWDIWRARQTPEDAPAPTAAACARKALCRAETTPAERPSDTLAERASDGPAEGRQKPPD